MASVIAADAAAGGALSVEPNEDSDIENEQDVVEMLDGDDEEAALHEREDLEHRAVHDGDSAYQPADPSGTTAEDAIDVDKNPGGWHSSYTKDVDGQPQLPSGVKPIPGTGTSRLHAKSGYTFNYTKTVDTKTAGRTGARGARLGARGCALSGPRPTHP